MMYLVDSLAFLLSLCAVVLLLLVYFFRLFSIGLGSNFERILVQLVIIILVLSAGYRDGFGYDYYSYKQIYEGKEYLAYLNKGPLFILIVYAFNFLSISFPFFLMVICFLSLQFLYAGIKNFFEGRVLIPFLIVVLMYMIVSIFGQIRQFFGLCALLYFLSLGGHGKFIGLVVSTLIHPSFLLFFPVIFNFGASLLIRPLIITFMIIAFLIGISGFIFYLIGLVLELLPSFPLLGKVLQYNEYWEGKGLSLSLLTMSLFLLFTLINFYDIKRIKYGRLFMLAQIWGAIYTLILITDSHLYGRVIKIFRLFDVLLVLHTLPYLRVRSCQVIGLALVVLAFVLYVKDISRLLSIQV